MTVGGVAVELTAKEYELLRLLSLDAGRVVTFETLPRRIWVKRKSSEASLVRMFVRNVRRKRGDSASWITSRPRSYTVAPPRAYWNGELCRAQACKGIHNDRGERCSWRAAALPGLDTGGGARDDPLPGHHDARGR